MSSLDEVSEKARTGFSFNCQRSNKVVKQLLIRVHKIYKTEVLPDISFHTTYLWTANGTFPTESYKVVHLRIFEITSHTDDLETSQKEGGKSNAQNYSAGLISGKERGFQVYCTTVGESLGFTSRHLTSLPGLGKRDSAVSRSLNCITNLFWHSHIDNR